MTLVSLGDVQVEIYQHRTACVIEPTEEWFLSIISCHCQSFRATARSRRVYLMCFLRIVISRWALAPVVGGQTDASAFRLIKSTRREQAVALSNQKNHRSEEITNEDLRTVLIMILGGYRKLHSEFRGIGLFYWQSDRANSKHGIGPARVPFVDICALPSNIFNFVHVSTLVPVFLEVVSRFTAASLSRFESAF